MGDRLGSPSGAASPAFFDFANSLNIVSGKQSHLQLQNTNDFITESEWGDPMTFAKPTEKHDCLSHARKLLITPPYRNACFCISTVAILAQGTIEWLATRSPFLSLRAKRTTRSIKNDAQKLKNSRSFRIYLNTQRDLVRCRKVRARNITGVPNGRTGKSPNLVSPTLVSSNRLEP